MVVPLAATQRELAERHVHLVRVIALRVWREVNAGVDMEELEGYGVDGLLQAAGQYDAKREASFTTFAWYRIRGAMYDGVRAIGRFSVQRRGQQRGRRGFERLDRAYSLATQEEDAEEMAIQREARGRVRRALETLPEREGRFMQQVYFGGMHMADAGAEMGISRSWASRLHARTVRRLRVALNEG